MAKGYFPLFFDTLEETQDLTDEEFGRLVRAVGAYASGDEDYADIITGNERYAFRFLKGQIDRNAEISTARAKAGANKKQQDEAIIINAKEIETNDNKNQQTETNENKPEQTSANSPKEKEKEKEKNKEKENKKREQERTNALFDRFWFAYPRHQARSVAQKAFEKQNPDEALLTVMLQAIEKQKASPQWQENGGQFIPHPATWLNQRRWEDEVRVSQYQPRPTVAQAYIQRDYDELEETPEEMLARLQAEM